MKYVAILYINSSVWECQIAAQGYNVDTARQSDTTGSYHQIKTQGWSHSGLFVAS